LPFFRGLLETNLSIMLTPVTMMLTKNTISIIIKYEIFGKGLIREQMELDFKNLIV
jgi:hypothetical protein